MISFFTSLKPFRGTTAVQQRNALRSWHSSNPGCEIIVFGAVEAGADVLAQVNATYRPDIACNEFGTPLISAIFAEAQRIGRHSVLCYINGDIILLPDFATAVARLAKWRTFAAVGQRTDIDWDAPIDFAQAGWADRVLAEVRVCGKLHTPGAMDFFVIRRGAVEPLPPFAIGRPAWDKYLIRQLLGRPVPIVDLSLAVAAVHQNHNYTHIPQGKGGRYGGPETEVNRALASQHFPGFKRWRKYYSIRNAQWIMLDRHVVPAVSPSRLWRRSLAVLPDPISHGVLHLLRNSKSLLLRFRELYRSALRFPFLRGFRGGQANDAVINVTQAKDGRDEQAPSAPIVAVTQEKSGKKPGYINT